MSKEPGAIQQDQIALLLEIDPKTLRKHFRDDVDRGMAEVNVKVGQSLFNMAMSGNTGWFIEGVPEAPSVEEWVGRYQLAQAKPANE